MSTVLPVITIQSDWNDVVRLPKQEGWISAKYLNQNSAHEKFTTTINDVDGKVKIVFPNSYQYIGHSNLSLVVKHVQSGLKVSFVAPTKAHKVHNKAILSVASAENATAISPCEGDKLLVWDSRTSEVMLDLQGHGGPVYKCRFFPSGIVVISAGADGSCRIWSAESGINPATLTGHKMSIADVCIIDKGRNIITVSKDGTAKLWDVGESRCLDNIIESHGPINTCYLATTSDVVEVQNEREIGTGNKLLVAGCEGGEVICAHVAKRQIIYTKKLESPCNSCIIIDQNIIIGCSDGQVIILNLQDGSEIKRWHESANPVLSMAVLNNQMFAVGRQDGTCTIMSLQPSHHTVRVQLTGSDCDGIRDISFNGKWILTACRDTYIRKYDFNQIIVHFK